MNDDLVQDLKQFIATTVTQQTYDLRADIKALDTKLSKKIDDLSESVAEALENANEATDIQLQNHEQRITRLEQKAA